MTSLHKCIIVDDEPPAIRLMEKFIEKVNFLTVEETFTNPLKALQYVEANQVDVIFLDIQMPEISGIQLSKLISQDIKVIFTTAYSQFALESYDMGAVDYLLKPVSFDRFYKAVMKLQESKMTDAITVTEEYFFVKTDGKNKFVKIFLKDILFVEGLKNYVSIQLKDEKIITYSSLKSFYESLPSQGFIQVHKSFIASIKNISKIDNDLIWIDEHELPLGNTYKKAFFEKIMENQLLKS
ncbi:LytR/AlgR family response regulator transcription factor [Aureibacter tunicatorum]|uniref:DNA-binding LytR/AlgR family response regulator n=1 Tax=Aureibacter tunicatorum TaxID=866807 RepID=A0AAE4BTF6_9BACT|nr:LytTR family DNA-binding domain-containing protein [Aureibacter tunicatorum]MDR6239532.1 DNA-binding LytR/AlgR family response regulator [Aureibacter tunicatorum]BDD04009.1 DNA-binding response regulator [Aureibacter tunicatorum]